MQFMQTRKEKKIDQSYKETMPGDGLLPYMHDRRLHRAAG
jgi:hypothetical protein